MPAQQPYFWKRMPFVRLIIPLVAGILIQYIAGLPPAFSVGVAIFTALILFLFSWLPVSVKYSFRWLPGLSINLLLAATGAFIFHSQDITKKTNWVGHNIVDSMAVLATLQEPLVEKAKSYKAVVSIKAVNIKGEWKEVTGKSLVYLNKDGNIPVLNYGSQIVFYKPLQLIKNSGNPGAFDYKRYNAFQDIYHQVFLKTTEYQVTETTNANPFQSWLFTIRSSVIKTLQQYIEGDREAGVAEALLIGYRNDLDKDLVQAYSNTGVVHIIAISGLHLGMIYAALVLFFRPFKKYQWAKWLKPLVILVVLWIFTLLAGGVPSILRSAVMFSFIVFGEVINKKSSIYNTLAASAFVMLCYNPYYLWDIGFLLSYAAVGSIVAFAKPIQNWFYIENKAIDFFWKLASVTLAAQILTTPLIFYSFHQFPNLFLITNCLIVPLSSIILFAELVLILTSFLPAVATFVGLVISALLSFMNGFIERISSFPYAVYDGIQNDLTQTILLYICFISFCFWFLNKSTHSLFAALASAFVFIAIDCYEHYFIRQQQKIIVYSIPQHQAIDFISAKDYSFVGDSTLAKDGYLKNFHLKPSRTLHRISASNNLSELYISKPFVSFNGKKILLIDKPFRFQSDTKIKLDLIVISHNPRINISSLANVFDCNQYVFDGSNSTWRIKQWKKDCDSLHLPHYSTSDSGAFQMEL